MMLIQEQKQVDPLAKGYLSVQYSISELRAATFFCCAFFCHLTIMCESDSARSPRFSTCSLGSYLTELHCCSDAISDPNLRGGRKRFRAQKSSFDADFHPHPDCRQTFVVDAAGDRVFVAGRHARMSLQHG